MPDAKKSQQVKKPYAKPRCIPKSIVEVAALLQEELSASHAIEGFSQPRGLIPGLTLLFEGYSGEVGLIRRTLESNGLCVRSEPSEHGDGPLEIRFSGARDISADLPSVLLLDFRLASQTGQLLLEDIGNSRKLRRVPIAILIDSAEEFQRWIRCDPRKCWRLSGPLNSSDVVRALGSILDLWRLPDELVLPENGGRQGFSSATWRENALHRGR